jgi:hypothetical protein
MYSNFSRRRYSCLAMALTTAAIAAPAAQARPAPSRD